LYKIQSKLKKAKPTKCSTLNSKVQFIASKAFFIAADTLLVCFQSSKEGLQNFGTFDLKNVSDYL